MRSGKLNLRLAIYRLPLNTLTPALVATVWGSLRVKPAGAVSAQTGLRSPDLVEIRLRQPLAIVPGDYVLWDGRLFHGYGLRDPDGRGTEWIVSAYELVGSSATYTPAGGTAVATRAFITHDSPYLTAATQRIDYRTRIELPLYEVGRAGPGGIVTVGGINYTLLGLADNGDDGVVRQYWGHA